jgi:serine/threonine-protein kinase
MDQFVTRPLQAAELGLFPSFSPDGQWVVFSTPAGIQRIPVAGGPAQVLAPQLGAGASLPFWGSDDNVLFANVVGLFRVPSRGGKPETLLSVDASKGETAFQAPQLLPGGKAILFGVIFSQDRTQGAIFNLETRERKILDGVTGSVRYVP